MIVKEWVTVVAGATSVWLAGDQTLHLSVWKYRKIVILSRLERGSPGAAATCKLVSVEKGANPD